jgi:hypothetical protein
MDLRAPAGAELFASATSAPAEAGATLGEATPFKRFRREEPITEKSNRELLQHASATKRTRGSEIRRRWFLG